MCRINNSDYVYAHHLMMIAILIADSLCPVEPSRLTGRGLPAIAWIHIAIGRILIEIVRGESEKSSGEVDKSSVRVVWQGVRGNGVFLSGEIILSRFIGRFVVCHFGSAQ